MLIDADGYTYCHEHLHIDLSTQKGDIDCRLDQYALIKAEMDALVERGVYNIIEVTNSFMGRNPQFIENLISDTGINILLSTGYYIEGFFPPELYSKSAKSISQEMTREIVVGIEGSSLKASVIGEIGSSQSTFTDIEKKVFEAAAMTHFETGRPISTHQSMSTMGRQQIELLNRFGVDMQSVTIGHCDLKDNLDDILWLLDQGCFVQFDTIGKNAYYPDSRRIAMLKALSERGRLNQVMLSMDITRRSHLQQNGGLGFCYLVDTFIPLLLENGISQTEIDTMMRHNPNQLFQ
ncbi:phosphotriesterase-related protein [Photobacterium sp. ZSDE20]|uniref:Phosphotriesterase-related protein n=1 Tax=Photobacterium pectinilyticum TaxID=2906793 RepID=A0ABT1MWF8_9GAMM|nr:phosphotriesterase-related protein [Photobacterium sp. ZSDE20]MCQ1056627.1 phosphotriesterase-related protein [Photobacterium sp. ZSDE20]MDD1820762.1 phosphotriesterase-related protein [Photobacterium sp. ZSDE20]